MNPPMVLLHRAPRVAELLSDDPLLQLVDQPRERGEPGDVFVEGDVEEDVDFVRLGVGYVQAVAAHELRSCLDGVGGGVRLVRHFG